MLIKDIYKAASGEKDSVRPILSSRWFIPTVVVAGFAVRLCWILTFHPTPVSDFNFYFQSAASIASGHGYVTEGGFATAYFPIGYSLFLATLFWVFGASVIVAQMANLILSMMSLVLVYWIARDLFCSEIVGRLSLLFSAVYLNNVAYTALVGVETLYLFLLLLGVALLMTSPSRKRFARHGRLVISGLVFGFATLVKVQTLLLPVLILLLPPRLEMRLRFNVDRVKKVAILYVSLIAVLTPWVVRNYGLYHNIVLSNNSGINLYIGNGPEATGRWVGIPWFGIRNDTLDEYKVDQVAGKKAVNFMRTHPWQTLKLAPKKLFALYFHGDGVLWNIIGIPRESEMSRSLLRVLDKVNAVYEFLIFMLFVPSLIYGCWRRLRIGKGYGWPLLGSVIIFYFTGIYLVYYGMARHNFPIVLWMMMYSAALLSSLFAEVAKRNSLNE